ncbi:MAG: HD domain-containing protein, partial [Thermotogaceae bacterium]|nr:HD domain-containing protein [Thermotogaceae bacterium]
KYTHTHSNNVARVSVMIGEKLGLSEKELEELEISAILHDVGKIGISDSILLKPGKLTKEEYDIIKSHTTIGAEILSNLKHVTKSMILGALEHHERCDGSGYPHGKQNGEISLFGRIIAVADVYDALTAKRVYKEGWDKEKVFKILAEDAESGKFDKKIVNVLGELIKEGAL